MLPLHLGALHPVEGVLAVVLAFGPFVVLWWVLRRRRAELEAERAETAAGSDPAARADQLRAASSD